MWCCLLSREFIAFYFNAAPRCVGRAAAAPSLTSVEALQQAEAEGLMLRGADNKAGYVGVSLAKLDQRKPYRA